MSCASLVAWRCVMEQELRGLEQSLWRSDTRFDRQYMEEVPAPDFIEFGRSGSWYDCAGTLARMGESLEAHLTDLTMTLLAPDVGARHVRQ